MFVFKHTLAGKIVGILLLFFVVALSAIAMTLYVSWQLEGAGAAINDAGSQRMRAYRMAYLLAQTAPHINPQRQTSLTREMALFEATLSVLERGDPARPLFLPQEAEVLQHMQRLQQAWLTRIKPLTLRIAADDTPETLALLQHDYQPELVNFVNEINQLVMLVERSNVRHTTLLRALQLGLMGLALVGTLVLILLFFAMIIRPVRQLQQGMQRMAAADFSVRLPVQQRDELGMLAQGFNQMADRLRDLYDTLEQRVTEKTHGLAQKNQELATLYDFTAFLSQPGTVEEICAGVLHKLMGSLGAQGGVVRLTSPQTGTLPILIHAGVSEQFTQAKTCLTLGKCFCGTAAQQGASISCDVRQHVIHPLLPHCQQEGFQGISAIPIRSHTQVLGIFNLFFHTPRVFNPAEMRLLETIGQHLGVAIENQQWVLRAREMAVSEERNLIAQELHDSIAQSLAFLNMQVQMLADALKRGHQADIADGLAQIREGVQESYDDVRELLVHFRTRVEHADLATAIRSALEKFEGQTGIRTIFQQQGDGTPLAPESVLQLLHIIQEALSNVRKHAHATHVTVQMQCDTACQIRIRDNGCGFDPEAELSKPDDQHIGLRIMKERAHRIGAQLIFTASFGAGTQVELVLPKPLKDTP